ncbi:MAG: DUF2061 domain-containing protein [Planctomycetota bacterium]
MAAAPTVEHESKAEQASTETRARSIAKTVSWRALASITTGVIALVALTLFDTGDTAGKASAVGSIAVVEVPSKLLLYYLHERVWSRVGWGRVS